MSRWYTPIDFSAIRAASEVLGGIGATDGLTEVVLEFCIGEISRLYTTPDQVFTWEWLRVEVIHECPQSTPDLVADNRISDLPAYRIRNIH